MIDYCATFQQSKICYCASDVDLHIDSNAACLVALHAKSRIARYFHLKNKDYPSNASTHLHGAIPVE